MTETLDTAKRLAALSDLRACLEIADEIGALEVIEGADPHLEMGALYELSLQKQVPPLLLFRKIKGYPDDYRVVCNVRSSRVFNDGVGLELVQNYRKGNVQNSEPIPSEHVSDGPVFENVLMDNQVDINAFPAPKWHAGDGGHYIGTECMVIAKDPDSDWVNAGTYRVQVQDEKTLVVFIEPGKHGDTIRQQILGAGASLPDGGERSGRRRCSARGGRLHAGERLRIRRRRRRGIGRPIELVKGARHRRAVPGRCRTGLRGLHAAARGADAMPEGPFGEWPGYYASERGRSRCCR